jgi:hypothetical protein
VDPDDLMPRSAGPRDSSAFIAHCRAEAEFVGVQLTTLLTTWNHARALLRALTEGEQSKIHPESHYIAFFVFPSVLDSVAIGIRRTVDKRRNTRSLMRLLAELRNEPRSYSLEECKKTFRARAARWRADDRARSRYEFDAEQAYAMVADASRTRMDAGKIADDMARLEDLCAQISAAANQYVAHSATQADEFTFSLDDIDAVLGQLWDTARKYIRLFDGGAHGQVTADWAEMRELYSFAWLPERRAVE